ncbi:hypothetical protein [Flavobacterium rhizosphaerae]|uniref:Uncharacterized protein n=1 Tax=Flavobacterium rhizosphaerae TaxID=3163298 RepID=A0ABW8YZL2_9FLAO
MKTYKISIPTPCHEGWDNMAPVESGRFCQSCAKNVIDFSGMTDAEVKSYLESHKGESICGRLHKSQVENITIRIPQEVLFSQTRFRNIFLIALLFTMGTTLLSCSDDLGNKQKIENVTLADIDTTVVEEVMGDTIMEELPPPPPLDNEGHFMGAVDIYPLDSIPETE